MIRNLLNREFVSTRLLSIGVAADQASAGLNSLQESAVSLGKQYDVSPEQLQRVSNAVAAAGEQAKSEDGTSGDADAWMPRDPESAILQTALERFYREENCVSYAPPGLDEGENPLSREFLRNDPLAPRAEEGLEEFGRLDPRWATAFIAAKAFTEANGTFPFRDDAAPTVMLGNKARLVMLGDWGSGVKRAQDVAKWATEWARRGVNEGRDTHVIALGDVYYAGFGDEYQNRFLNYWPVTTEDSGKIGSWNLNGNHDMYSGGYGYFSLGLGDPRFAAQKGSSYFLLENDSWQIAGLDSAYDPPDLRGDKGNLYGGQAAWLEAQRRRAPGKKGMLLSHHQLFSAWETDSPKMREKLRPLLDARKIDAWFWGHEHRCAVYKGAASTVPFASLVGHGGVPVKVGKPGGTSPTPLTYQYPDEHISGYAYMGLVVVDLDDAVMTATYVNERGHEHHHETL